MISPRTQLVGLLGDPVAHSLSPRMQNHVLVRHGIDAIYLAFRVDVAHLGEAFSGLAALGARGWNLTIPHKEAAVALVDALDPEARAIGAINTVVAGPEGLRGYNTDASGLLEALAHRLHLEPQGLRALVLGAGGAARAAVAALVGSGAEVTIVARNAARAKEVAQRLGAVVRTDPYDAPFDLIVHASPIGMPGGPDPEGMPIALERLAGQPAVMDLVYREGATPLVAHAHAIGLTAVGGEAMLAAQGRHSFALWFGEAPPLAHFLEGLRESSSFGSPS